MLSEAYYIYGYYGLLKYISMCSYTIITINLWVLFIYLLLSIVYTIVIPG